MKLFFKLLFLSLFIYSTALLSGAWAQVYEGQDASNAQQDQEDSWWKSMADVNKDGNLDDDELRSWEALKKQIDSNGDGEIDDREKRIAWKHIRLPITTGIGQDFDANSDGWLQPEEARKLLFRAIDYVFETNGRGPIRSEVEKAYDSNEDGVIDLEEVKTLREDLR